MARAYSSVLGCMALSLAIMRGVFIGQPPDEILTQALFVLFTFICVGFCIGYAAEKTVYESVEKRFREEMARLSDTNAKRGSETSEE